MTTQQFAASIDAAGGLHHETTRDLTVQIGDTYRANRQIDGQHVRILRTWDGTQWVDGPVVQTYAGDGRWIDAR